MNKKEQEEYLDKTFQKMKSVLVNKSSDYAGDNIDTDKLKNFKVAGNICGISPELNCLSLIATKVARLGVLLNSDKSPVNESIQDSVLDLSNYALLLGMLLEDKNSDWKNLKVTK